MSGMAPYLHSTTSAVRSSIIPMVQTSFTLPTAFSAGTRRQQNNLSAEHPSRNRSSNQQQRLSLMLSDLQKVRTDHCQE